MTAQQFRLYRRSIGRTQAVIGRWFGVSTQTVARWEKGKTAIPGPAQILMQCLYREHQGAENVIGKHIATLRALLPPETDK